MRGGTFFRRAVAASLLAALTAGCVGGSGGSGGSDRRRPVRSARPRPAPPPVMPDSAAYRQCAARLGATGVRFTPLPNADRGAGCDTIDTIKLLDIGTPTTNLGPMTCPLAAAYSAWARFGVVPASRVILGSEVVKIETFGTYSCRNIVGNPGQSGRRSEHAHANAVDISAFVLADGRRISLQGNWHGGGPERAFLDAVRASACKRFRTVLSPDYNAAHYNHFHLDMGGRGGFCR